MSSGYTGSWPSPANPSAYMISVSLSSQRTNDQAYTVRKESVLRLSLRNHPRNLRLRACENQKLGRQELKPSDQLPEKK
jgi:hypothetical protein